MQWTGVNLPLSIDVAPLSRVLDHYFSNISPSPSKISWRVYNSTDICSLTLLLSMWLTHTCIQFLFILLVSEIAHGRCSPGLVY